MSLAGDQYRTESGDAKEQAAIMIQKAARRKNATTRVQKIKAKKRQTTAAVSIQRVSRSRSAKALVKHKKAKKEMKIQRGKMPSSRGTLLFETILDIPMLGYRHSAHESKVKVFALNAEGHGSGSATR